MTHSPASTRPQGMTALREIARALSAAWDLDTTLDLMARKTTEVMHVDSCTIYLLDPDGVTLRLRATTGLARRALGRATLQVGEGMTGLAVAEGQPIYDADAPNHPAFKRLEEADETPFRSLLAVPLTSGERPLGAMNVQTLESHAFSADEVTVLALIGDLAAGALAKAQLYDRQRRQIEELEALAQVSEAVTSPQYLDDILAVVTTMAARAMAADVCAIYLLDESGEVLHARSTQQASDSFRARAPLRLGEGITGRVAATGQVIYVPDVRDDPRFRGREQAREEGLVSMLSVPLSVRDRVIGALNCYTTTERQFSEAQTTLFTTLANQTALAIENARLVTNAAVVKEMHHRIKNNLQTVAMLMQLQLPEATLPETREVLTTNMQRIRTIAAVHEVLSEEGFRLVDVREVLQRITRMTAASMTPRGQEIAIDVYGEAITLPSRAATALALAVNELVHNALTHGLAGRARGRIEISFGRSPEELVVVVRDDGVGPGDGLEPGLGLEIVTTLVREDLQGQMDYGAAEGGGLEVTLRMPRRLEAA